MAPVAALIVVRPCIEVNAVEGDSLDADAQGEDARPHFAVEAVLVHAEVGGGVAHGEQDAAADRVGERAAEPGEDFDVGGNSQHTHDSTRIPEFRAS
jgi:hypothetical protein